MYFRADFADRADPSLYGIYLPNPDNQRDLESTFSSAFVFPLGIRVVFLRITKIFVRNMRHIPKSY